MPLLPRRRGSEFCQLQWDRVQYSDEDGWFFRFIAKGGDEAEQELYVAALVEAGLVARADLGVKLLADGDAPQLVLASDVDLLAWPPVWAPPPELPLLIGVWVW